VEQVTIAGKVTGKVKGTFRIWNIPMLKQITVGILTERGIQMIKAPILFTENEDGPGYTSLFGFFKSKINFKHPKIIEI
jgi:hypothetical protein